jgi:hypothetical protein
MKYQLKPEFFIFLLVVLISLIGYAIVYTIYPSTSKTKETNIQIIRDAQYYGAVLNTIIDVCKEKNKKFNEEKFARLTKQKIQADYNVTLQRVLVEDNTGNYYIWKARVYNSSDSDDVTLTWR